MKAKKTSAAMLVLGLMILVGTIASFAQSSPLSVVTPLWWQLVLSLPTTVNPGLDATGADCMVGQRGPIWFLAGTFAGSTTRTCSIPEGEYLFFPVINEVNVNAPNVCGQNSDNQSVAFLRSQIAPFINAATNLSVQLDGKTQNFYRVKSDPFAISPPADNLFNAGCGTFPAGTYSPAVDDGYYSLLPPPTLGMHTLHIHAESGTFVVDATYHLTIVPVSLQ